MNPEIRREQLKAELSMRVQRLLSNSRSVDAVAAVLGAEEFLVEEGRGSRRVKHFEVRRYIDAKMQETIEVPALPESVEALNKVILPPGEGSIQEGDGEGEWEPKKHIPRSQWVQEVLQDMGAKYHIYTGEISAEMMRNESYLVIAVPELERVVFVCDEEGNATRVVHHADWAKDPESRDAHIDRLSDMTKIDLDTHPDYDVQPIRYLGNEGRFKEALIEELVFEYEEGSVRYTPRETNNVETSDDKESGEIIYAQEGEYTERGLAKYVSEEMEKQGRNISQRTIIDIIIPSIKEKNPDLQPVKKKGKRGKFRPHYSPEFVGLVMGEGVDAYFREFAQEGEYTERGLAKYVSEEMEKQGRNISQRTIIDIIIPSIKEKNPDLQQVKKKDKIGRFRLHYSAKFVALVMNEVEVYFREFAQEDEYTKTDLATYVSEEMEKQGRIINRDTIIYKIIPSIEEKYPDLQPVKKKDKMGRFRSYYPAEFVGHVMVEVEAYLRDKEKGRTS